MRLSCGTALVAAFLCVAVGHDGSLEAHEVFYRGDCNGSSEQNGLAVDIADPIAAISFLYRGAVEPPCLDACDANDDGKLDLADVIFYLRYLFDGGALPPDPGPGFSDVDGELVPQGPGHDPTADGDGFDLGCGRGV